MYDSIATLKGAPITTYDEYGNEVMAGYLTLPLEKMEKVCDELLRARPADRKDVWK